MTNISYTKRCSNLVPYFLGLVWRRYKSIVTLSRDNANSIHKLILSSKMPKRVRSSSTQKSKKSRNTGDKSPSKRNPIPRTCKNPSVSRKGIVDFSFLSLPNNKVNMNLGSMNIGSLNMGSNQAKQNDKIKEKKKDDSPSVSNDELDVVYDVQEEKKNKIYEVITVMSDDETPDQITYERIYAEDPEKRVVNDSEIKELLSKAPPPKKANLKDNDLVGEIVKEANFLKARASSTKKTESETGIIKIDDSVVAINTDTKDDSDNEVICVAVLDSKSNVEQKRTSVEEICLSSDSESESLPKISPLRLKIPFSGYPYVNKYHYRQSNDSENSYGSTYGFNSNYGTNNCGFSFGQMFNKPARIYPCFSNSPKSNDLSDLSDWESNSEKSKSSSVADLSPAPSESPKELGDDSSSSVLSGSSQHQQNLSPRSASTGSDNETHSNPSSPSLSETSDEEKDIYWKANRETRRKEELRYEEFTDFGKKIHEGEIDMDVNTTFTFKVMSYNVLAQNLLEGHLYLYKHHDRRALSWARRWALIYEEIKDENPEILCLQEVDTAHLASHYAKLLDLGYRWVFKKRTGRNSDGVAVFYKAAVFDVETRSEVEFFQPGVSVLDRDNVGVVIRLRLKNSPSHSLVVATTHLLYNPRRSDVRLAQVQLLLAEIDKLAYNKATSTYDPVILTGDFNLKPLNGVYHLVTEGRLCYEGTSRRNLRHNSADAPDSNLLPRTLLPWRLGITDRCQHVDVVSARVRGQDSDTTRLYNSEHNRTPLRDVANMDESSRDDRFESGCLCHEFNFRSVYTHTLPDGQHEASTHHESWVTVDYIFYSSPKTREEESLHLLSKLRLPTQDECDRFLRHLPNFAFGSDHLPLVAKFLLQLQHPGGQPSTNKYSPSSPTCSELSGGQPSENKYSPSSATRELSDSEDDVDVTSTASPHSLQPQPSETRVLSDVRSARKYSRQFLLTCAASPFSLVSPVNWNQIIKECPMIAKKESNGPTSTQVKKQSEELP